MSTLIVAEAGINHDGDLDKAKQLATAARLAGADAVKFQTFIADTLALDEQQLEQLSRYQLSFPQFRQLKKHCDHIGIEFMSTPFCVKTAQFLHSIDMQRFKISSGNATNMALLKMVASFHKQVILSLGMTTMEEKNDAVSVLLGYGVRPAQLTLMYCRSQYPATEWNIFLGNLCYLQKYHLPLGFSDHSMSTSIPVLAVAMGARVIEKHFTLWPDALGADHSMSMDPASFEQMVMGIRKAEEVLSYGPQILPEEQPLRELWLARVGRQNGERS